MYRILFSLSTLFSLLVSPLMGAQAVSPPCYCSPFDGSYIGGSIGLSVNTSHLATSNEVSFSVQDALLSIFQSATKTDMYENKPVGEIFIGWGSTFCQCFYLGVQGGLNVSSFSLKNKTTLRSPEPVGGNAEFLQTQKGTYKAELREIEYVLDGKIGWLLCDDMLGFVLVGVAFNRPALTTRATSDLLTIDQETETEGSQFNITQRNRKLGSWPHFRFGVGIEKMLNCNLSVHLHYTYTDYDSLTSQVSGSRVLLGDALSQNALGKASYHRQQLLVGISHYF